MSDLLERIGVVVIGRNEGERLRACLGSVVRQAGAVVYVDSGSIDQSVPLAGQMGVEVVELDMSVPFTAARARNAGFERLLELHPGTEFVQFVDGDCEVVPGWLERAARELAIHPRLGMVCGRNRERYPDASIYNRLCDIEWDTPVGRTRACGGIAMARAAAFREVGGYNPSLIAGEEPEMCFRLRQRRWRIVRLDAEMTLHDAAMTRFGQWWKRAIRGGHAFAEGAAMHGRSIERFRVRETRSNWFWGLGLPLLIAASAIGGLFHPLWAGGLVLLFGYPLLGYRVYVRKRSEGRDWADSCLYAFFVVLGKFPAAIGQCKYSGARLLGRKGRLIEYKNSAETVPPNPAPASRPQRRAS